MNQKIFETFVNNAFSFENNEDVVTDVIVEPNPDMMNISEREKEIISLSNDNENGVDYDDLVEDNSNLSSDILVMEITMKTAEDFIWKSSVESTDNLVRQNIFEKFWKWLKSILIKMREFVISLYKRALMWITGEMKPTMRWAAEHSEDLKKAIEYGGDIVLKIKKPIRNPLTVQISDSFVKNDFYKAVTEFESGKVDETVIPKIEKFLKDYPINFFDETVYGKGEQVINDVKLSEFNNVVKIVDTLTKGLNTNLAASVDAMNDIIKRIKDFTKDSNLSKFQDEEDIRKIKSFGSLIQKFYSHSISATYHKFIIQTRTIKIAKVYASKALKEFYINGKKISI